MNKILYLGLLLLFSSCFSKLKKKENFPSFNILLLDSVTLFNTQNIPEGRPFIIVFFSPDCEHCQKETADLLENMNLLRKVNFYFITIESMDRMKVFYYYYKLYRYPNITLGRDYTYFFPSHFSGVVPPYSVIYDQYKRLRAVFKGETMTSQFAAIINKL
jgi:thiol-disulfide isomerase/thioredoxin